MELKVYGRWNSSFNPENKHQSAQWKHTDSPPPKKLRLNTSVEKLMVAMFMIVVSKGVVLTHYVPKGTTMTSAS